LHNFPETFFFPIEVGTALLKIIAWNNFEEKTFQVLEEPEK